MALVNQNMVVNHGAPAGQGQGNADYALYNLASAQATAGTNCDSSSTSISASCTFHDITKGNNSVPCVGGSFGCSNASTATGAYGVEEAYNINTNALSGNIAWNTAVGLDLATGLGSVDAFNLVSNWPTASFTPTTTALCLKTILPTSSSCGSGTLTITHGTTVYVNAQVSAGGNPIPVSETSSAGILANPNTPRVAEDVALIGTFPAGSPYCVPPVACNTAAVDHFTSNSYALSNYDIYPLTNGSVGGLNSATTGLVGGTYNVEARYSGDGKYGASVSAPFSLVVNPEASNAGACVAVVNSFTGAVSGGVSYDNTVIPPAYSCSTVTSAYYGDFIILRADVVGAFSGQQSATGIVTLYDGGSAGVTDPNGNKTSNFPLNAEGYVEDQTTFFQVGSHSFQVTYGGDPSYAAVTAKSAVQPLTILAAPTLTQITSPSNNATLAPGTITVTAFVDTALASNLSGGSFGNSPTGTMTFKNAGGTVLGTGPVNLTPTTDASGYVAGSASVSFNATASLSVTAVFTPGDSNYQTSTSSAVSINVGTPGVTPSTGCSAAITVSQPGQSGNCLISVSSVNSFTGSVTMSAAVTAMPPGATDLPRCSFGSPDLNFSAPGTITLTSTQTTGNATLTCSTTAASQVLFRPSNRPAGKGWPLFVGLAALVSLFCLLVMPSQRRWRMVPLGALLAVITIAGIGCSSSGGSINGGGVQANPGTTTGTYTVTVTTTPQGGSAEQTPITLTVTQAYFR